VADWATVKRACNRLDKRWQWLEDVDAETVQPQSWKKKVPTTSEPSKPTNDFGTKAMEGSIIEVLSRKFETFLLANMNHRTQKGKDTYKCVWCDSLEHKKCNCAELREAIRRNETRKPLRVNFGKGGMEKIVEEEDAQHVDAMHYAVTAVVRVGRENLKLIETRIGFWPIVFECEKKGRIDSEDLELAGRNLKCVTGWADLVDNITSFTEVVCDNYKALVDEKRKRTVDEDGTSK
jgi:hypothetical protein